jgi:hypothetical protein
MVEARKTRPRILLVVWLVASLAAALCGKLTMTEESTI